MLHKFSFYLVSLLVLFSIIKTNAQQEHNPIRYEVDENRYYQFSAFLQVWGRLTQNNPGSLVYGDPEEYTTDISLRRFRFKIDGVPFKHVYFALQAGDNNLNYLSERKVSIDLLDAYVEFRFLDQINFGAGKSAWDGLSRYTSPATGSALLYDIPMLPLSTLNISDDLLRSLNFYIKGRISKLDYRFIISKPFAVQNSSSTIYPPLENIAEFANNSSERKNAGYIKWMFFDMESNNSPFSQGTYFGDKKVFNVGAGYKHRNDALWYLNQGDTTFTDLNQFAFDAFLDLPLNKTKNTVLTIYTAFFMYNFGPNYIRNIGPNNPIPESDPVTSSFNGKGNAYPAIGTGNSFYTQAGYLLPYFKNKNIGQLQLVADLQVSDFDRLDDFMLLYNVGINWAFNKHYNKLSLNFQNRPIFYKTGETITQEDYKWMFVVQYQFKI